MTVGRTFLLALASIVAVGAAPQEPPPFRAGVEAVRVDVLATRGGHPVSGLAAGDFEVLDNGVAQRITLVDVGTVPVNLALVLDTSESVEGPRLASLVGACRAAVGVLRPIDRAAVVTFSNVVTQQVPLTGDRNRLSAELNGLSASGGTALYDATYSGLLLGEVEQSRTLLLIFSDGRDTASWLEPASVLDAARRSADIVYGVTTEAPPASRAQQLLYSRAPYLVRPEPGTGETIFKRSGPGEEERPGSHGFLENLATATGGRLLGSSDPDLPKRFVDIVKEFQNRYVLAYTPTGVDTPGWHEITVRVRKKDVDVRARRGYWQ